MASGYGLSGGQSRCFKHWQEFQACFAGTDSLSKCEPLRRDYVECLHHDGEKTKARIIAAEKKRQILEYAKEQDERRKVAETASRSRVSRLDIVMSEQDESSKG